jgi:hypothetical protein
LKSVLIRFFGALNHELPNLRPQGANNPNPVVLEESRPIRLQLARTAGDPAWSKEMTIKDAIFVVETLAHLQGCEHELLPIVDSARKELAALKSVARAAVDVACNATENCDSSEDMNELLEALEALK